MTTEQQASVNDRQWRLASNIAIRMVKGDPYTDNDVHQLAEAVAYLSVAPRQAEGWRDALEKARECVRNLWRSKALREREHYHLIALIDEAERLGDGETPDQEK